MASASTHWANHAHHQHGKHTGGKACDLHEGDEGIDALPLDGVLDRDHSSLSTGGVPHQGRLHLCRANAVPTHVDHIVHTPCSKQSNQDQQPSKISKILLSKISEISARPQQDQQERLHLTSAVRRFYVACGMQ